MLSTLILAARGVSHARSARVRSTTTVEQWNGHSDASGAKAQFVNHDKDMGSACELNLHGSLRTQEACLLAILSLGTHSKDCHHLFLVAILLLYFLMFFANGADHVSVGSKGNINNNN